MGAEDKIRNAMQDMSGKVKETTGSATDNRDLQAEGQADQTSADFKQAGEKIKDAFKS